MMWKQSTKNILVVGHRGVKAFCPENTMASFRMAIALGVDGIKMDINMTKDGHLMVIHDTTVDRTTNGTGLVSNYTLEEINKLDAGSYYGPEFAGEKIPTFREFLDLVKDRSLILNIEIKDYRTEVVDLTIQMLEEFNMTDTYVITCFNADITTYAHEKYGVKIQGFPEAYVTNYREDTRSHYYSVGIGMKDLTKEICDQYSAMNIDPWCRCPDDEESIIKAIECGATLATVNNPLPALNVLRVRKLHS